MCKTEEPSLPWGSQGPQLQLLSADAIAHDVTKLQEGNAGPGGLSSRKAPWEDIKAIPCSGAFGSCLHLGLSQGREELSSLPRLGNNSVCASDVSTGTTNVHRDRAGQATDRPVFSQL